MLGAIYKRLPVFIFLMAFGGCQSPSQLKEVLQPVGHVDIKRYMGTWYEIASYPQWFQRGCQKTRATYALTEKGEVDVLNECLKEGKMKKAKGRAWIVDKKSNAKLKVQFFLNFIKLPFLAGDYWIISLDEDYRYAVISEAKKDYLWILSRAPLMEENLYRKILKNLKKRGFDLRKLQKTIQ